MRHFILYFTILFSSISFAQNTGSIIGVVFDEESFNEPLIYVSVTIEGTTQEAFSDKNGLFHFDNLSEGNYALIFNFVGYESKKLNVKVTPNQQTNIGTSLSASGISLNELESLNIVASKSDKNPDGSKTRE
jgi:hypothetical protein